MTNQKSFIDSQRNKDRSVSPAYQGDKASSNDELTVTNMFIEEKLNNFDDNSSNYSEIKFSH